MLDSVMPVFVSCATRATRSSIGESNSFRIGGLFAF